jgi:hypothetical protein
VLQGKINRFITLERLQEVAHGMDTQANESFNNRVSWFAPKNKVYCGSGSLHNRVAVAVGVNTLGFTVYFRRLFRLLGIQLTDSIVHFLQVKEKTRTVRLEKLKSKEKKQQRMADKHERMRQDELVARKERVKRQGVYVSGMNMDEEGAAGYTAEDLAGNRKRGRADTNNRVCPHCHKIGHSTIRSKHCLLKTKRMLTHSPELLLLLQACHTKRKTTMPMTSTRWKKIPYRTQTSESLLQPLPTPWTSKQTSHPVQQLERVL